MDRRWFCTGYALESVRKSVAWSESRAIFRLENRQGPSMQACSLNATLGRGSRDRFLASSREGCMRVATRAETTPTPTPSTNTSLPQWKAPGINATGRGTRAWKWTGWAWKITENTIHGGWAGTRGTGCETLMEGTRNKEKLNRTRKEEIRKKPTGRKIKDRKEQRR